MSDQIRVRFAPSPTGFLHLGSGRTAMFNWLYARHMGGKFILRIEDTDRERSKKEFLDEILEDLKWLGLDWDEGPFFQSERNDLYVKTAQEILEKGLAYREGNAIIFKVHPGKTIKINDLIHGEIVISTDEIKDQVLIKSDGSAAYNFACVVDDAAMGITHIIRGDDHISNTPKQVLFYEALGLKQPHFAHMPLMMGKDGAKLSKRHGGVSVTEYKEEGFLPEALSNYLMLLGWMPKDGREIVSLNEAFKEFDVKDINNVQARFDIDKLRWMNAEYIKVKKAEALYDILSAKLKKSVVDLVNIDKTYFLKIIELYKTRFKTLSEFWPLVECFFTDDYKVDENDHAKYITDASKAVLKTFLDRLKQTEDFTAKGLEELCRKISEELGVKASVLIHPTRVAISGITKGAGLFEMMEVLGKDKVLARIERVLK